MRPSSTASESDSQVLGGHLQTKSSWTCLQWASTSVTKLTSLLHGRNQFLTSLSIAFPGFDGVRHHFAKFRTPLSRRQRYMRRPSSYLLVIDEHDDFTLSSVELIAALPLQPTCRVAVVKILTNNRVPNCSYPTQLFLTHNLPRCSSAPVFLPWRPSWSSLPLLSHQHGTVCPELAGYRQSQQLLSRRPLLIFHTVRISSRYSTCRVLGLPYSCKGHRAQRTPHPHLEAHPWWTHLNSSGRATVRRRVQVPDSKLQGLRPYIDVFTVGGLHKSYTMELNCNLPGTRRKVP